MLHEWWLLFADVDGDDRDVVLIVKVVVVVFFVVVFVVFVFILCCCIFRSECRSVVLAYFRNTMKSIGFIHH